jgi:hypothetical protein
MGFIAFNTTIKVLTNPKLGFPLIPNLSLLDLLLKAGLTHLHFYNKSHLKAVLKSTLIAIIFN